MRYFNDYIRSPAQTQDSIRKSLNRVDITKKDEEKQYVFGWAKIAVDENGNQLIDRQRNAIILLKYRLQIGRRQVDMLCNLLNGQLLCQIVSYIGKNIFKYFIFLTHILSHLHVGCHRSVIYIFPGVHGQQPAAIPPGKSTVSK